MMKFKKLVLISLLLFATACTQQAETEKLEVIKTPNFIVLEDVKGHPLGKAFLGHEGIWITPDHLYEVSKELFYKGEKILVLARDFDKDLLAFSLEGKTGSVLELSNTPPDIGKEIYWFDSESKKSEILNVGAEFEAKSQKKKNLLSFAGVTVPGASGGVVFDEYGKIWGMIIGADREKREIFAVRSDNIMRFLKEIEI